MSTITVRLRGKPVVVPCNEGQRLIALRMYRHWRTMKHRSAHGRGRHAGGGFGQSRKRAHSAATYEVEEFRA